MPALYWSRFVNTFTGNALQHFVNVDFQTQVVLN